MPKPLPYTMALQEFGLTQNEAKIYLSLLHQGVSNGNQLARDAGVPSAKVYEVLDKLKELGLVAITDSQREFVPLPLQDFLKAHEARTSQAARTLLHHVAQPLEHLPTDALFQMKGRAAVLAKLRSLLSEAQHEVLLSLWPGEVEDILEDLRMVAQRRVHITAILFMTEPDILQVFNPFAHSEKAFITVHAHVLIPTVFERHASQGAAVLDDTVAVLMEGGNQQWSGVWTSHPAVVSQIANYIRHDIYINKLEREFREPLVQRFGHHLTDLLDARRDGINLNDPAHSPADSKAFTAQEV